MEENQRFAHGADWTLYSSDEQEDEQPIVTARRIPISFQGHASVSQPGYPVPFNDAPARQQPPYPGPNPAPLPIETNITITTKRPRSQDYTSPPVAIHHPSLPNNYYLPPIAPQYPQQTHNYYSLPPSHRTSPTAPIFPTGYTSQPMSLDNSHHSHHSHASIAETEPAPHLSPPSPLPYGYPRSGSYTDPANHTSRFSTSPGRGRDRGVDGRPVRKSPKTEYTPYYYNNTDNNNNNNVPLPPPNRPFVEEENTTAMSRSSSGPGIALPAREGLGIVGFGAGAEERRREVQFGGMAPVNFQEAGRRRLEYERRLEEAGRRMSGWGEEEVGGEGGVERRRWEEEDVVQERRGTPYPDANLIPSASDPVMLGRMLGEGGGSR